jgi:hypothetical protein
MPVRAPAKSAPKASRVGEPLTAQHRSSRLEEITDGVVGEDVREVNKRGKGVFDKKEVLVDGKRRTCETAVYKAYRMFHLHSWLMLTHCTCYYLAGKELLTRNKRTKKTQEDDGGLEGDEGDEGDGATLEVAPRTRGQGAGCRADSQASRKGEPAIPAASAHAPPNENESSSAEGSQFEPESEESEDGVEGEPSMIDADDLEVVSALPVAPNRSRVFSSPTRDSDV